MIQTQPPRDDLSARPPAATEPGIAPDRDRALQLGWRFYYAAPCGGCGGTVRYAVSRTCPPCLLAARKFRRHLFRKYDGRCAVTACDIAECLQAAHIRPRRLCNAQDYFADANGILLRADVHAAFDAGVFTLTNAGEVLAFDPALHFLGARATLDADQLDYVAGHREWALTQARARGLTEAVVAGAVPI